MGRALSLLCSMLEVDRRMAFVTCSSDSGHRLKLASMLSKEDWAVKSPSCTHAHAHAVWAALFSAGGKQSVQTQI